MKEKLCIIRKKITTDHVGSDCFYPAYKSDYDFMKKCTYHKEILCSSKKSRNPSHHKLIFAIAKCIMDNLPEGHRWQCQAPYDLIKAMMLVEGIVDLKLNLDGSVRSEAKSISFESMDEDAFQKISEVIFKYGAKMLKIEVVELETNYLEYL